MKRMLVFACIGVLSLASGAQAQRLQDRIDAIREQDRQRAEQDQQQAEDALHIPVRMATIIPEVFFDHTQARTVFNWWSTTTGVPMVIDWNAMELEGIDPEQPITLDLQTVPASLLLNAVIRQASTEVELIYEVTPWYIHVMTKHQANRFPVIRVYDVSDMVVQIPHFNDAPSFDLTEALSNTNSGGGGGSSSSLFSDSDEEDDQEQLTRSERGQEFADLIINTVEPDVWQVNGGTATIWFYDGRLIVNAPRYVHKQIGIPTVTDRARIAIPTGAGAGSPNVSGITPSKSPYGTR